jgi:thiol-disulfide isomerase/thioredoxin
MLEKTPQAATAMTLDSKIVEVPTRGKVTVVDFWATFCEPCVKLMPDIEALWRQNKGRGVVVVGVAGDDNPGHVKAFLERMGVTYPTILDGQGSAFQGRFQVSNLPQTFIFDRHGRLRVYIPANEADPVGKMRRAVEVLLREPV